MAAILGGQSGDERRPPARDKAVIRVQRAETRKARVDDPQFVAGPGHFVDGNVTSDVRGARQITRVVLASRLDARGDVRGIAKGPDLVARAESHATCVRSQAHRPLEGADQRGQAVRSEERRVGKGRRSWGSANELRSRRM